MKYPRSYLRRSGHALTLLVLWCSMGPINAFGSYEPESRHVSVIVHAGDPVGPDDVRRAGTPPATCREKSNPGPARTNEALQRGGAEQINPGPRRTNEALQRGGGAEQINPGPRRTNEALQRGGAEQINPGPRRTNETGEELYRKACATCHGADGKGAPATLLGFDIPLPDFTDCSFATREPDADWLAVAHQGGPIRGFAREMPAFGDALTQDELQKILDYIRTLCPEDKWPRGELNTPRALVTEKAFPEDEAVLTTTMDIETERTVIHQIVYEKRFGARNQFEVTVPFGFREHMQGGQLGDVALGLKRVVFQRLSHGSILSLGGEVILPTGHKNTGIGKGITRIEPFASFGQVLTADAFLQFQGGFEIPLDRNAAVDEAFFRGVAGKSFTQGDWGRTWSPMLEVLGTRSLGSEGALHWDIVPQAQITLNQRQHVVLNIGLRMPVNHTRNAQFMIYLLWEWFDGGFFEGW